MLVETLIILLKIAVIIFGFVMLVGSLLTFVERKQSAWIQNRVGPNRANFGGHIRGPELEKSLRLGGVLHFLADGLKMLTKEDIIPEGAHRVLHTLAPAMALFPAMVIFAVIPWMDHWCVDGAIVVVNHRDVCLSEAHNYFSIADLDVGFLYVFAIASIEVYAGAIAGWASNSKFSLLGGLRGSAQMISYEVSMGLSVLGIVMIFGTLNLNEIVQAQGELLWGVVPMWGIIVQPIGFLLFLTAGIAESKRAPFDLPEGESELVAGFLTEYSSMKFAVMTLADFIAVVFVAAITATLFLGGWQVPFLYGDGFHAPHWLLYPLTGVLFLFVALYLKIQVFVSLFTRPEARHDWDRITGGRGLAALTDPAVLKALAAYTLGNMRQREKLLAALTLIVAAHGLAFLAMGFFQRNGVVLLPYLLVVALRIGAMVFKVLFLCWFQLMIRWTLPRFRYDQVMKLGWKIMLPVSLVNLVITAAAMLLFA